MENRLECSQTMDGNKFKGGLRDLLHEIASKFMKSIRLVLINLQYISQDEITDLICLKGH